MVDWGIEGASQATNGHFSGLLLHDVQHGVLSVGSEYLTLWCIEDSWPALAAWPCAAQGNLRKLLRGQYGSGGHHRGAGAGATDRGAGDHGRPSCQIECVHIGKLVSQLREASNLEAVNTQISIIIFQLSCEVRGGSTL